MHIYELISKIKEIGKGAEEGKTKEYRIFCNKKLQKIQALVEQDYIITTTYTIVIIDGEEKIVAYPYMDIDSFLHDVSCSIAYSDCSGDEVKKIVFEGIELEYMGWMPNMRFVFKRTDTGEVVYDNCFPSWDH